MLLSEWDPIRHEFKIVKLQYYHHIPSEKKKLLGTRLIGCQEKKNIFGQCYCPFGGFSFSLIKK